MVKQIIFLLTFIGYFSVVSEGFACPLCFLFGGSDTTTETTFIVEGMTCNECVSKVESVLNELQGVKKVEVSLKNKQATVKYDKEKVTVEELIKNVEKAGFKAELAIPNIILDIEGMTCGGCQEKVQSALNEISGVKKAEVSLETSKAIVEYEKGKVSVSQLIEAVDKAGFQVKSEK